MRRAAIFVLLAVALDLAGGAALDRLFRRVRTGDAGGLLNYAIEKDADVLVLGSSRARHHFVPAILSEKLGLTVFDAGLDGHEFLYGAVLLDLWRRTHAPPRAIVVHVDAHSLLRNEDELQKAALLAPYVDESERAREVLYARGRYERLKLASRLYRFNGKALSIAKNLFERPDPGFDGYVPLERTRTAAELPRRPHGEAMRIAATPYWELKVRYLEEIAAWCAANGTRLFLVHSPTWLEDREARDLWQGRLARLVAGWPAVELVDVSDATFPREFAGRAELYDDAHHLNARGAALFSSIVGDLLRERLPPPAGAPRRVSARPAPARAVSEVSTTPARAAAVSP